MARQIVDEMKDASLWSAFAADGASASTELELAGEREIGAPGVTVPFVAYLDDVIAIASRMLADADAALLSAPAEIKVGGREG